MDDEPEQDALFEIEGPDEDGCVWICPIGFTSGLRPDGTPTHALSRFSSCTMNVSPVCNKLVVAAKEFTGARCVRRLFPRMRGRDFHAQF